MLKIRSATLEDKEAIVQLWHQGWHDAHALLVPADILAFRTKSHFHSWFEQASDTFYLALLEDEPIGFVSVKEAEVVKLYVGQRSRGSGAASKLLDFAERTLRQSGILEAELLCTAGNIRAERFYQRQGWTLVQTLEDALWMPDETNQRFVVLTHRLRKSLME